MDILIIFKNGPNCNIFIHLISVRRIKKRYIISGIVKQNRHHFQCFIVLVDQFLAVALVHLFRRIFITSKQRRSPKHRMSSVRQCVRIPGKAVELFPQFRFLLKQIWNVTADRPIQHDDDHILPFPADLTVGIFLYNHLAVFGQLPLRADDIENRHAGDRCNQQSRDRPDAFPALFENQIPCRHDPCHHSEIDGNLIA